MSRHDLAAVPMAAVRSSAQALGVSKLAFCYLVPFLHELLGFFCCTSVCFALIAVVLVFTKPAPVLPPPVPVRHRRSWLALRLSHVAPSHTISAEDVKLG